MPWMLPATRARANGACQRSSTAEGLSGSTLLGHSRVPSMMPFNPERNPIVISTAYAQTAAPAGAESQLLGFLPIILMFVAMYFLMIRW